MDGATVVSAHSAASLLQQLLQDSPALAVAAAGLVAAPAAAASLVWCR